MVWGLVIGEVDSLTVPELRSELRDLGVTGYCRMRKAELQNLLRREIRRRRPRPRPRPRDQYR